MLFASLLVPLLGPAGIVATLSTFHRFQFELRFNLYLTCISLFVSIAFFVAFFFTENPASLRGGSLVVLSLLLLTVLSTDTWKRNRVYLLDRLYQINVLILVLSALYGPLATIFVRSGTDIARIGGLIGYDFVAFFVSTYLITAISEGRIKYGMQLLVHVLIATYVVLNSGRFGFVILSVFFIFIIFKFPRPLTWISILLIAGLGYITNPDRVLLILQTLYATFISISQGGELAFSFIEADTTSGFYVASPLTWISEFQKAFSDITANFFPSSDYILTDSGLSFMVLNSGFILSFAFYLLLFQYFRVNSVTSLFIAGVFILTDLKFRSAFSAFPMFWLILNRGYETR